MFPLPAFFKRYFQWSIAEAERLNGGNPATTPEVLVCFFTIRLTSCIPKGYCFGILQNLYREDLFYADKEFTVWSMQGPDGTE